MENTLEFDTNALNKIVTLCKSLTDLLEVLNVNLKSKSKKEKRKIIQDIMNKNLEFKEIMKCKGNIMDKFIAFKTEIDKIKNFIESSDEEETNTTDEINNEISQTDFVTLDDKQTKSNQTIKKIELPKNEKYSKLLSGNVSEIDFAKDGAALLILEKSNYVPIKYINKGQFGSVYRGKSKTENKEFALKIIQTNANLPEKYLTIEQKVHKLLNNQKENIIFFYEDLTLSKEFKCLVLELADDSLESLLKKNYPNGMPEKVAFFFFEQIFRGVSYMHKFNVIHRDLKDANILLKDYKVKICDFNVCRIDEEENSNPITSVGTKNFISPELLKTNNIKKEDWRKLDVFSLGILLYVMIYGKIPFIYNDKFLLGNRFYKEIESISYEKADGSTVSEEAKEFIKKCLVSIDKRISVEEMKNNRWFKKLGLEFNSIVKNKKISQHKELWDLIQ